MNSPFKVSQIVEGGSIGMGTTESSRADIDLVLMSTGKQDEMIWKIQASHTRNSWSRSRYM